jgi:hypothetical protein
MRVANVRGAKRVTLVGASGAPPSGVSAEAGGGASESLKFRLIEPHGTVQRGKLRIDLGPVKKERKRMKPVEKRFRKLIRKEHDALGRYLQLHDRSRRKRRSGWLGDLGSNLRKVVRRSK